MKTLPPTSAESLIPTRMSSSYEEGKIGKGHEMRPRYAAPKPRAMPYFCSAVIVQLSDFFFPLFLFAGLAWWMAPHLLKALMGSVANTDPQIGEVLEHLAKVLGDPLRFGPVSLNAVEVILVGFAFLCLSSGCLTYLNRMDDGEG